MSVVELDPGRIKGSFAGSNEVPTAELGVQEWG